jgi:hypothetical protein
LGIKREKQDGWGSRRHWRSRDFCRLLGLGCPKQAFAKIATPFYRVPGGAYFFTVNLLDAIPTTC